MTGTFEEHRDDVAAAVEASIVSVYASKPEAGPEDVADAAARAVELDFDNLVGPAARVLAPAAQDGGDGMIAVLSVPALSSPYEQVHEYALAYARERAAEMIGMTYDAEGALVPNPDADMVITDATRNMVRNLVIQALSPGNGTSVVLKTALEDLKDEITGGYLFSRERAALIAQVELGMAHNEGELASLEAFAAMGLDVEKAWSTAKDDKVCSEICASNAMAGYIPVTHLFPSGHRAPLGHPKCRCALIGRIKPQETTQ